MDGCRQVRLEERKGARHRLRSMPRHHIDHQLMHHRMLAMRTTVTLDDALMEDARSLTGIAENATLLREALTALIEREAARRLARLGGSDPDVKLAPRRRLG